MNTHKEQVKKLEEQVKNLQELNKEKDDTISDLYDTINNFSKENKQLWKIIKKYRREKTESYYQLEKLIELIEHNKATLWNDNLESTSDCIILEDINSKDMRNEEYYERMKDDECYDDEDLTNKEKDNYQFTGYQLHKLIEEIKDDIRISIKVSEGIIK